MPDKDLASLSNMKSSPDDLLTMKLLREFLNFKPPVRTRGQKIAKPAGYTAGPDTQQTIRAPLKYMESLLRLTDDEAALGIFNS